MRFCFATLRSKNFQAISIKRLLRYGSLQQEQRRKAAAVCIRPTSRFRKWRGLAGGSWRRGILRGAAYGSARFCKITAAGADLVAIAVGEFNFDFVVAAVGDEIGRAVGNS